MLSAQKKPAHTSGIEEWNPDEDGESHDDGEENADEEDDEDAATGTEDEGQDASGVGNGASGCSAEGEEAGEEGKERDALRKDEADAGEYCADLEARIRELKRQISDRGARDKTDAVAQTSGRVSGGQTSDLDSDSQSEGSKEQPEQAAAQICGNTGESEEINSADQSRSDDEEDSHAEQRSGDSASSCEGERTEEDDTGRPQADGTRKTLMMPQSRHMRTSEDSEVDGIPRKGRSSEREFGEQHYSGDSQPDLSMDEEGSLDSGLPEDIGSIEADEEDADGGQPTRQRRIKETRQRHFTDYTRKSAPRLRCSVSEGGCDQPPAKRRASKSAELPWDGACAFSAAAALDGGSDGAGRASARPAEGVKRPGHAGARQAAQKRLSEEVVAQDQAVTSLVPGSRPTHEGPTGGKFPPPQRQCKRKSSYAADDAPSRSESPSPVAAAGGLITAPHKQSRVAVVPGVERPNSASKRARVYHPPTQFSSPKKDKPGESESALLPCYQVHCRSDQFWYLGDLVILLLTRMRAAWLEAACQYMCLACSCPHMTIGLECMV